MIIINNHYPATIWFAIQWYDPACGATGEPFRMEGWFKFEAGEYASLNISQLQDLRQVGNHFYYFIIASDGAVWAGPFASACPQDGFFTCIDAPAGANTTVRGFREIIIENQPDYTFTLLPNGIRPRISVEVPVDQAGFRENGYIHVTGDGFTPLGSVNLFADNLVGRTAPMAIGGPQHADIKGHFDVTFFEWCWEFQVEHASVRGVDTITGLSDSQQTDAFNCS